MNSLFLTGHILCLIRFGGEIVLTVSEANKSKMKLQTHGSDRRRSVVMSVGNVFQPEWRELHIDLAEDKRSIVAQSDAGQQSLRLKVCDDGVVCLAAGGKDMNMPQASRFILEPFLFEGSSPFRSPPSR